MKTLAGKGRKRFSFIFFNVLFGIWFVLLIWATITGEFSPFFYDVLHQADVSANYSTTYPLMRILFEPFLGLHFTQGLEFDGWMGLFFRAYIFWKIILFLYYLLFGEAGSQNKYLKNAGDAIGFAFKWGFIAFVAALVTLGIGFVTRGYLFVTNNYNWIVVTVAWTWLGLLVGKLVYNGVRIRIDGNTAYLRSYFTKNKMISRIRNKYLHRGLSVSKREIMQFLQVFGLLVMLNQAVMTVRFPTQQIATDLADDEFLFDFHVHTLLSDGSLSPVQRVKWYMDQGIHGAAFSDHHHPEGSIAAQKYVDRKGLDFTVMLSQEFTDDPEDIHLNIWGIDEPLIPTDYDPMGIAENTMTCEEVIGWVKARGGYVTVNHYSSGSGNGAPFTFEQLRDWGVDGFEVINGGGERDPEIRQFCLDNNLICMAGTDDHKNGPLNTLVKLRLDDPANRSLDAIFEALYRNEHEAVLIEHYRDRADYEDDGLESLVNYFLGLSAPQLISWYLWSSALLVGGNVIYFINIKKRKVQA